MWAIEKEKSKRKEKNKAKKMRLIHEIEYIYQTELKLMDIEMDKYTRMCMQCVVMNRSKCISNMTIIYTLKLRKQTGNNKNSTSLAECDFN